jgi:hypothetical protein
MVVEITTDNGEEDNIISSWTFLETLPSLIFFDLSK